MPKDPSPSGQEGAGQMKIQKGDLFRVKSTGEILEITGKWGDNEYRINCYNADGYPDCGANGQHNIASNIEEWFADGGLEKIKPLPTKRALIRTYNYGNYYGKQFIVDNIETKRLMDNPEVTNIHEGNAGKHGKLG